MMRLTHFAPAFLCNLAYAVGNILSVGRRGKKPSISTLDTVFIYVLVETGLDLTKLAAVIHRSESVVKSAVDRVRGPINVVLRRTWFENRRRHVPDLGSSEPQVAIATDAVPFAVGKPHVRFEESKIYWDQHHGLYALKKEVSVLCNPPHYCVFAFPGFVGSRHDFAEYSQNAEARYAEYLKKTQAEITAFPQFPSLYWLQILDSGYMGDAHTNFGRVVLRKPSSMRDQQERDCNAECARIRVVVEQFFGRLKKLWGITVTPYRFDHTHFDVDVDNAILLTNEHIAAGNHLGDGDDLFFWQCVHSRCQSTNTP
eukprot:TRINITY_DN3680_c0_g1_i15.p1 TRINITY_DN3680_c0_g1~~TRINITY_DN3680_c0_g1_i15.p1  ORF type:complete len:313 (+),score=26.10 TRINITY_DN3680_c0_g1_i15:100-1038(+)